MIYKRASPKKYWYREINENESQERNKVMPLFKYFNNEMKNMTLTNFKWK